jgi:glucose-1-phosphate cytidylyltransferase
VKVVIFCGGQGLRMREASAVLPKPMVPVGGHPILWHVMKYYAHYGHKDFILCLGYKGEAIKQYFLNYNEALANDFVLSGGGGKVELVRTDMHDWKVTFVDTGQTALIGERLRAVRHLLDGEETFLAHYGDVLTDAHLPDTIDRAQAAGAAVSFLCVRPNFSFHLVSHDDDGRVRDITDVLRSDIWINGGFFVLKSDIFSYLRPHEDLVEEPIQRLVAEGRVLAQRHEGFWAPMDTLKDNQLLENLNASGNAPWQVWETGPMDHAGGAEVLTAA